MKLYIKQCVFSFSESFEVRNENNAVVYYVKGSFFSIPKNFKIYDVNERQVGMIEAQLFRWMPHYDISTQSHNITLKRSFTFLKQSYELIGTPWVLKGDFWSHEYRVINGTTPIMSISKHWFTWGDSYELNILNEEDALLCLAIVIAVDAELGKSSGSGSSNNQ